MRHIVTNDYKLVANDNTDHVFKRQALVSLFPILSSGGSCLTGLHSAG